jgi:hypothetical protein
VRDEEYEAATVAAQNLTRRLMMEVTDAGMGSTVSGSPLHAWLKQYLTDPAVLESGQGLTPLLALGGRWVPIARTLKGGMDADTESLDPDARGPFGMRIWLKNTTSRVLRVQKGAKRYPKGNTGPGTPSRWDDRPQMVDVAPGEEVELTIHYAVAALGLHSWRGWSPELWGRSAAIPQGEDLAEVGYALDAYGVDSRAARKARKAS